MRWATRRPGAVLRLAGRQDRGRRRTGYGPPGVAMTADSMPLWYCCAKPLLSVALAGSGSGGLRPLPAGGPLPAEFAAGGKTAITSMELLTHTAPVPTGQDPLHGVVGAADEVRLRRAFEAVVPEREPGTRPVSTTASGGRGSCWRACCRCSTDATTAPTSRRRSCAPAGWTAPGCT
ncbi:serine hydrolase domain-containing protein [Streptomyces sp. INA 01156]